MEAHFTLHPLNIIEKAFQNVGVHKFLTSPEMLALPQRNQLERRTKQDSSLVAFVQNDQR